MKASRPASSRTSRARRRRDGLVEVGTRLRVEVDAQLVGVVAELRARSPRVEHDGVHLRGPDGGGRLIEHELRMRAAARVDGGHRAHIVGRALRRVLREELLAVDPSGKRCSETGRSPLASMNGAADRDEIPREVDLRDAGLRPEHSGGARHADHLTPDGPSISRISASVAMQHNLLAASEIRSRRNAHRVDGCRDLHEASVGPMTAAPPVTLYSPARWAGLDGLRAIAVAACRRVPCLPRRGAGRWHRRRHLLRDQRIPDHRSAAPGASRERSHPSACVLDASGTAVGARARHPVAGLRQRGPSIGA